MRFEETVLVGLYNRQKQDPDGSQLPEISNCRPVQCVQMWSMIPPRPRVCLMEAGLSSSCLDTIYSELQR